MDYICIGARNLIFKFGRWRSENYEVRVSPSFAPTDSYEIVDALRVADPAESATVPGSGQLETAFAISRT